MNAEKKPMTTNSSTATAYVLTAHDLTCLKNTKQTKPTITIQKTYYSLPRALAQAKKSKPVKKPSKQSRTTTLQNLPLTNR